MARILYVVSYGPEVSWVNGGIIYIGFNEGKATLAMESHKHTRMDTFKILDNSIMEV